MTRTNAHSQIAFVLRTAPESPEPSNQTRWVNIPISSLVWRNNQVTDYSMLEIILNYFDLLISEFVGRGKQFFCSPKRPDLLCGPSNVQFNYHQMHFGLACNGRGMKLTTPLQLRTDVTNEWAYSFAVPYAFMAWIRTILPFHALHFTVGFLVQFHEGWWPRIRETGLSFPWLLTTCVKYPIYNHNNTYAKNRKHSIKIWAFTTMTTSYFRGSVLNFFH